MHTVRFALIGLGNIGRNLLDILVHRSAAIAATYELRFVLVGAADSRGAALCADGLDMAALRDLKLARRGAGDLPMHGRPGLSALDMLAQVDADVLVDASPTNLVDGEPGMSCVIAALERGMHLVFASKGPLVLAYEAIMAQATTLGSRVLFSGTVAGGLPTVNIGVRDLAGCGVTRVEGIFNGTTNYILTRMEQEHLSYEEARQRGAGGGHRRGRSHAGRGWLGRRQQAGDHRQQRAGPPHAAARPDGQGHSRDHAGRPGCCRSQGQGHQAAGHRGTTRR